MSGKNKISKGAEGEHSLTKSERSQQRALRSAEGVQRFLDQTSYNTTSKYFSPRTVLATHKAHCFDGALFAAAALEELGHEPLLMDLRAVNDDDHVLAVFRRFGRFGAIAASNFSGLRYREPVYKSLRELAMSYFELYFNVDGQKTLREHSVLLDLRRFDRIGWRVQDQYLDRIATALDRVRHFDLLSRQMARNLNLVDERSKRAGLMGSKKAGLYKP